MAETAAPEAVCAAPGLSAPGLPAPGLPAGFREMTVLEARWEAESVISLTLADPAGEQLPTWEPGAHVDVRLPSGLVRQYSLCGDTSDRTTWKIAILREESGRGGSAEVHDTALVGRRIGVRGPRNHFPLRKSDAGYILIAGGIGVTPILAMARKLSADGEPFRMLYGGRSAAHMAFRDEISRLAGPDALVEGIPDLESLLSLAEPGTEVYCCGPEGLIGAVRDRCRAYDLPLHTERFTPSSSSGAAASGTAGPAVSGGPSDDAGSGSAPGAAAPGNDEFEVELASTGTVLTIACGKTILETVREQLPDVVSSCEEGFCGACETRVIQGTPDHRDEVLDDTDRESGEMMMICVSRSRSPRLVLDL